MTRRMFAGMRSAIVTSRVIGGALSVAAEILRDFTRHVAPRLIELCYVNASVRLRQCHRSHAVIARHAAGSAVAFSARSGAFLRSQIATFQQNRTLQSRQPRDKTIRRYIEKLAQQLS